MKESVRKTIPAVGLIILALGVYWPSTTALWDFWTEDNHAGAHGPLVAAMSAWLVFRARERLAAVRVRPSVAAGGLLVVCSVLWLIFWRAGIQELYILLLPLLMGLAVYTALGYEAALQLAVPLGFLYFAVPAWGIFIHPLQALTIRAVGVLAPLIGVPSQIEGNLVRLPGVGTFEIAGGCSGVNFLTAGLAIAVLMGEIERASLARRGALVAMLGMLAVFSNWIRVLAIIDAGYTTNMRHVLVTQGHYMFGWMLFTVIVVAFVWIAMRPQFAAPRVAAFPASGGVPLGATACASATLALAGVPLLTYAVVANLDSRVHAVGFVAPAGRAGWQGPTADAVESWNPEFVGPHSQWHFSYKGAAGRGVEMMAIGYSSQAQGRELVSSENSLLGASSATALAEATVTLGTKSYIETIAVDARGHRSVVWSVYDIGGREFVTPLLSQLWYGLRSLGGPPYSMLFAFRAACDASCDAARDTLRSFLETMGPDVLAAVNRGQPALSLERPV